MNEYLEYSNIDILERVDEYSLYCHYLGFEPFLNRKYSSPFRTGDIDPSFSIFERRYNFGTVTIGSEFLWKDNGAKLHGPKDIFDLVLLLNGYSNRLEALWKVCADFNLGGAESMEPKKLIFKEPLYNEPISIKIKSKPFTQRDLLYWQQFNVTPELLNEYLTTSLDCYWLTEKQEYPNYPKGLGFAYRIFNMYQLYFPFQERKKKFRNNWNEVCIPGFAQLRNNDLCIITKSVKDIMCLRSFGYDAISPKGENVMLPQECIDYLGKKYKRVVTLFDNDGKHKAEFYPFEALQIPLELGQKDPTDFCAAYGPDKTEKLIKELL